MSVAAQTSNSLDLVCTTCACNCQSSAKFCSNCGTFIDQRAIDLYPERQGKPNPVVPDFALVTLGHTGNPDGHLTGEATRLMLLLARERLFLYMHWLFFLGLNLFGLSMATKCYYEFLGDELTKLIMGFTPLLYINICSLLCIVPIRGTRKEITRLKEKLHYVKFQIEYGHLL